MQSRRGRRQTQLRHWKKCNENSKAEMSPSLVELKNMADGYQSLPCMAKLTLPWDDCFCAFLKQRSVSSHMLRTRLPLFTMPQAKATTSLTTSTWCLEIINCRSQSPKAEAAAIWVQLSSWANSAAKTQAGENTHRLQVACEPVWGLVLRLLCVTRSKWTWLWKNTIQDRGSYFSFQKVILPKCVIFQVSFIKCHKHVLFQKLQCEALERWLRG